MKRNHGLSWLLAFAASLLLAACGGGGGGGTTTTPTIASVTITASSASLAAGSSTTLSAVVRDTAGSVVSAPALTWQSSNTAVATVDASGKVTGVAVGTAQVTAASGSITSNVVTITVTAPVASVTLAPTALALRVGASAQVSATAKDAAGNTLSGAMFTWQSSNPAAASVDAAGKVTAVAVGVASITATSGSITSSPLQVTVTAAVTISSVTVTPTSLSLAVGGTAQLTATAKDGGGNTVTGTPFTWLSSNSAVATVDTNGLVTAVAAGSAQITAQAGSVVSPAVPVTVNTVQSFVYYKRHAALTPQTATLTSGGTFNIDGKTLTGVYMVAGAGGTTCLAGGSGTALTACFSPADLPHTMLLCGPDPVTAAPNALLYVLFDSPDPQNTPATATMLLNALQSPPYYLGIGVYTDCSGSAHTGWIRNYPNTNYYLWPDVITTYSSAYVSGLLNGAVINATPTAGSSHNNYVVVRSSASVFEVWH